VEDIRPVLDRNLMTVSCCRENRPEMIARKSAVSSNIGSISGLSGTPVSYLFHRQAAVHEYTRCLAAQLRPDISASTSLPRPIIQRPGSRRRPIDEIKNRPPHP